MATSAVSVVVVSLVGIDPGLTGAVAILEDDGSVGVIDMPCVPKSSGKGGEVCAELLAKALRESVSRDDRIFVEAVHAMPGNGATSMFGFGRSLGVVLGVLAALGLPYELVRPMKWKRAAGIVGKPKDASRGAALRLYPAAADLLKRKKDSGRADAILIGHYGGGM